MMTALEFLKERKRICHTYPVCEGCPINDKLVHYDDNTRRHCNDFLGSDPEEAIEIVGQWVEEHSVRTRQSEFLKIFPNASLDSNRIVDICPRATDAATATCENGAYEGCSSCRQKYWLSEVSEDGNS